jgi:ribosomal protein S7
MKKEEIIRLTTEGDCEGRSVKTVGYFKGSLDQIITYCIKNNINPYYNFKAEKEIVIDVTEIKPEVSVTSDSYGSLVYVTPKELEETRKKVEALSKLTEEEKKLLGLKEN